MFGFSLAFETPPFRPSPALQLYFAGATTLDSRITFTRADAVTCATYFDSTGRLQLQGRNNLTYSSTFTNAAWTKTDVTPTLGESSPLDVGYLMTEGSAGTAQTVQAGAIVTAGSTVTASAVVKRGNTDWVRIKLVETLGVDGANAYFNLNTGVKGSAVAAGAGSSITNSMTSLGGGWYRCTLSCIPNGTYTVPTFTIASAAADNNGTRVSGATYTVSAAQLETGSTATTYSATTTAANSGPRFDYDPATAAGVTGGNLWSAATQFSAGTVTASGADVVFSGAAALVSAGQAIPSNNGKTFIVTFTIADYVSGDARIILYGNGTVITGAARSAAGTYTETLRLTTAGGSFTDQIRVQAQNGGTLRVTGISVQEVTFTPRGLLIEESRKNNLLHSRDMTQAAWTKTDVTPARTQVGIDGVANTACLMTEGTLLTASTLQVGAAVTAGSTVTGSFVVKRGNTDWIRVGIRENAGVDGANAWFNLNTGVKGSTSAAGAGSSISSTMTSLGGGWYRCIITCIPNGTYTLAYPFIGSASADGSGTRVSGATYIVDCAQLEVGAFATSIIPCGATALTRAADSASMTGANFSSWYNSAAGTFVANWSSFKASNTANAVVFDASNGTLNERVDIQHNAGMSNIEFRLRVGGVTYDPPNVVGSFANTQCKSAIAYDASSAASATNGGNVTQSTPVGTPTLNTIALGSRSSSAVDFLNGHLRSLRFYPSRLSNATLVSLTS